MDTLTDYSIDDRDSNMSIRTELLDPIVSSTYRYQFRLDTSAFLDKNTLLLFKPKLSDASKNGNIRLNTWNGGLGCLRAVEFQVGDFQVQRIEDIDTWASANMLYNLPPDVQTKKIGHFLHNQLRYEVSTEAGAGVADLNGQIKVDNTTSGVNYGQSDTGASADINSMALSATSSNNHKVGIPLGMLLPMLEGEQLPLFLMTNYKVHITFEFQSDASEFANDKTKNNFAGGEFLQASNGDIVYDDVQLLVDYLILPARVQNDYLERANSEGGLVIDFVNPVNVKKTESAKTTANVEYLQEHRINLINQEVHYLQQFKKRANPSVNARKQINKVLLGQRSDGYAVENIQFNVNGVDVYTSGFLGRNPQDLYNNCSYVLGRDLQVVKPLYIKDPNTCASMLSPPDLGLLGKYKPLMLDLTNGEPTTRGGGRFLGQYPIIVRHRVKPTDTTASDRVNTATEPKYFTADPLTLIDDEKGETQYTYFAGTTRVLNVKTLPNGSQNVIVSDM